MSRNPDVVVLDNPVAAARRDDMAIPGKGRDLSAVARHSAEFCAGLDVPELDGAVRVGDREEGAVCCGGDRGDERIAWGISEVGNRTGVCALAESDGERASEMERDSDKNFVSCLTGLWLCGDDHARRIDHVRLLRPSPFVWEFMTIDSL